MCSPYKELIMGKYYTNLDFHQTFKPEKNCLCNLLMALPECDEKTVQEISKITGIPTGKSSGKVVPSIWYLTYMGLIQSSLSDSKYKLQYTELGNKIMEEDPGIMEELTLLLMHCMLTRMHSGAELWSFIINTMLPMHNGKVRKDTAEKEIELRYGKKVNVSPFNGTYVGLFSQLNLISLTDEGYLQNKHLFNEEFIYLYGLVLYEYWDEWIQGMEESEKVKNKVSNTEITAAQLWETKFRYPFGWSEQEEYHTLEKLHDKGIITLNRQMVPFVLRKAMTKEEVMAELYSELC